MFVIKKVLDNWFVRVILRVWFVLVFIGELEMVGSVVVNVGDHISCLYPKHGRRNILCKQSGNVVQTGNSVRNGGFVTIQGPTGAYRTLSVSKMVSFARQPA